MSCRARGAGNQIICLVGPGVQGIRLYVLWGQGCAESDYMSCGAISAGNQIISFVGPGVQGIRLYVQFVSVPIHVC